MNKSVEPDISILDNCEKLSSDSPAYKTEHYIVEADKKYILKAVAWAKFIESNVYRTMLDMMGHTPTHNLHILHFTDDFLGRNVVGKFCKFESFRGFYGSRIRIIQKKLDKMPPYQKEGGITHETIHGLLDEAKNSGSRTKKWEPIWQAELLDRIFEMELCQHLGDETASEKRYHKRVKKGGNYAVFAKFWKAYGWEPFKSLIVRLHDEPDFPPTLLDQNNFAYYMSLFTKKDVSDFFENCGWDIDKKTKERITKDLR